MFNENQIKAISHKEGPAIVLAGPGSGKTTVIIHRIQNLIRKCNVPPENILVVTFTKAAALEMRERFLKLMNKEEKMKTYPVTFGTFHSVYYQILRLAYGYKGDNIVTDKMRDDFIKEIAIRIQSDVSSMSDFVRNMGDEISKVKGNMINVNEYHSSCCNQDQFIRLFHEYERELFTERKIDFDDMILKCYQLLKDREDVLKIWQEKFQYILVDEAQDANSAQFAVIKLLAQPQNNIFIVGDDDQSIYGFRGAHPEIMLQFQRDYKEAQEIVLDVNYRSTSEIMELAQNLIQNNHNRFIKNMVSERGHGIKTDIRKFQNQGEELKYVCSRIKKYMKEGINSKEIAILVRNNAQVPGIQRFLQNEKIVVNAKKSGSNIYDSMVAKDIIAYIRAALFDISLPLRENPDLIYILNKPPRFISRQVVCQDNTDFETLKMTYQHSPEVRKNIEKLIFHLKMIANLNPSAALTYIRNGTGYEQYLYDYSLQHKVKLSNLIKQFDKMQSQAEKYNTLEEWLDDIERQKERTKDVKEEEGINIMTMHSSKGLEFQAVFIVDANQGVIPSSRAVREKDFQEERRVFYVAVTRAKEILNVYGIMENLGCPVEMSMFVGEMIDYEKSIKRTNFIK